MPVVRFVRGVVWNGEPRAPGFEAEVSDREAFLLCDGYQDAVRVDGRTMVAGPQTTQQEIQTRDPVAAHRDPVMQPQKRRR